MSSRENPLPSRSRQGRQEEFGAGGRGRGFQQGGEQREEEEKESLWRGKAKGGAGRLTGTISGPCGQHQWQKGATVQLQWHHVSSESVSLSLSHTHTHFYSYSLTQYSCAQHNTHTCSLMLHQIPVESDESDTDQRNGHRSDEGAQDSADEAHSDDPPPPKDSGEGSGANGKSIKKEKVENSDYELNHSDDDEDELEMGDSQGEMDQSECSASELVDSMEQDLDGSNQPDSS